MRGLKLKSMQIKLWKYFIMFAASELLVLWFLQIVFFTSYYEKMKTFEVEGVGKQILSALSSDNFEESAYQIAFKNGMSLALLDQNGAPVQRPNYLDPRTPRMRREWQQLPLMLEKIDANNDKPITMTLQDEGGKNFIIIYGAAIQQGNIRYLLLNAPLSPTNATINVLKSQLLIVTTAALLFSFLLSFFLARRLATPIAKLTNTATFLAKGNYDVHFEHGSYHEINQLADALNYTAGELSKTEELRRDLISNVSHDLRTPLTIIKSYGEMIRDLSGENTEKRKAHLNVIIDETDRLSSLVTDMLDLSKMESNAMPLNKKPFDFAKTVSSIYNSLQVYYEEKGYSFHLSSPESVFVTGDCEKIRQVIYNLMINAVNYTGADNSIKVVVELVPGRVRFSVSDTGSGIPKEEQSRVWERYYKSANTNRREDKGSGIGLAIVKNILELHQADYGVHSAPGQGSTFWFELPLSN